mgnify:FL=1
MSRSVFSYNCLHIDLSLDCVAPSTFASPIKCAAGLSCSEFKVTASIKLRLWVNCCLWRHVSNELVVLFGSVRFSFCTDFKWSTFQVVHDQWFSFVEFGWLHHITYMVLICRLLCIHVLNVWHFEVGLTHVILNVGQVSPSVEDVVTCNWMLAHVFARLLEDWDRLASIPEWKMALFSLLLLFVVKDFLFFHFVSVGIIYFICAFHGLAI